MQEQTDKATPLNVSLYPEQIKTVQAYADYTGLRNFSATLRMIINEWARQNFTTLEQIEVQESAA